MSYPDGDIGHNCTIGMSESAAQAVADKYNALMRGIADSHSARMKMLEDIKSTLPLADIECARTYANHWQWRYAAHGYPDYMGYAKSKKAALQAAIHSIATDIVDNKYRKES